MTIRVAAVKPDHGGIGGFERLLERLVPCLGERGIDVVTVPVDARTRPEQVHGVPMGHGVRDWHDEYFLYLATLERLDRLDLSGFDVVLASQPPTYLARHPAVVALTYHQARVFYDLAEEFAAAGFADPAVHAAATEEVRAIDAVRIDGVARWVVGSDEVAARLADWWGIEGTTAFRARADLAPVDRVDIDPTGPVLCVSRHEWPKRTELVVQAAAADPALRVELVGGGSRLPWVADLVRRADRDPDGVAAASAEATWRNAGPRLLAEDDRQPTPVPTVGLGGRVVVHGEVTDAIRDDAYALASVVVAPALREDYGLTVLEAFARARPVVVCRDGGGLVELVGDTGAGLVVDPEPTAIAKALAGLRADPDRVQAMAEAALAAARADADRDDLAPLVAAIEAAAG